MQPIVALVLALLISVVAAQNPSLSLVSPARIWAGVNPQPHQVSLLNPTPVPFAPGTKPPAQVQHYSVTLNPTGGPGLTIVPSSIVLSDANNFISSYQIIVGTPPVFGTNGKTPQPFNITWDAVSDFSGYSNLDVTVGGLILPRMFDIITTEGTTVGQPTSPIGMALIQNVPSGPITIRAQIPPPPGTVINIEFPQPNVQVDSGIAFSPASGWKITSAQPWTTFSIISTAFTNNGTIDINFTETGSPSPYYVPGYTSAFSFATQLIPVRIENFPQSMLVGVPYQFTVALDIPVPAVNPPITLVVTPGTTGGLTGAGLLQFSPASLSFGPGVAAQTMTVIAPSFANVGPNTSITEVWFTLNPNQYNGGGPFSLPVGSIEHPIPVSVSPRSIAIQVRSLFAQNPIYLREPFPLEISLPYPTPTSGGLTVTFAGGVAGTATNDVWSFDRNSVTFTTETSLVVWATLNVWPRASADTPPFNTDTNSSTETITYWLSGADAPLYVNYTATSALAQSIINVAVNRRTVSVVAGQYPSGITLVPGIPSEPIMVWVSDPDVLPMLTGTVTLTPFANSPDAMVTFLPPTLTFGPGSPSASVQVVVAQQPQTSGFSQGITVSWALGGNANDMAVFATPGAYSVANFPTFTIAQPQVSVYFPDTGIAANPSAITMTAGQTIQMVVSVDYLPSSGLSIIPSMTEAVITPSMGSFTSSGPQVLVFTVHATAYLPQTRTLRILRAGPNAAYYNVPATDITVTVQGRSLAVPALVDAQIGAMSDEQYVSVQELPNKDVTLTPVPASPNSGISFVPASITFSPTSPFAQSFKWTGSAPGSFAISWVISGSDAAWYALSNTSQQVNVKLRDAPVIGLQSGAAITAGYVNSPISVTLSVAPDADLTVTPNAPDWTFTPTAVSFSANNTVGVFSAMYTPHSTSTHTENAVTTIFYTLSGTDSWKYARPAVNTFVAQAVGRRSVSVSLPSKLVVGVPTHGSISLPTHPTGSLLVTPIAGGITFDPPVFNFDPTTMTIHFTATASIAPNSYSSLGQPDGGLSNSVTVFFTLGGSDAGMYLATAVAVAVSRRSFLADVRFGTSDTLRNPASGYGIVGLSSNEFIVGRNYSNVMTITTVAPATSAVTLTPTCPYVSFSPATLTFSPDVISGSLSITPIAVPPQGVTVTFSWVLGGADELLFETAGLPVGKVNLLPNMVVSPIPAIYIDGVAKNLSISMGAGQSVDNSSSFIMSVQPVSAQPDSTGKPVALDCVDCVVIEPNTFVFSAASSGPKTFQIRHVRPMGVPAGGYHLNWMFRTVTNSAQNAVQYPSVTIGGSTVRVLRYQIVPDFPFTLGYRTCQASINITRAPQGTLTITPGFNPDNAENRQLQSIKAAAGNVIFTPAQLVFMPGQTAAKFSVRLDRRIDETALYYRVDYSIQAHPEDAACYLPFESTWHVASATAQRVLLVLAVLAPLALLMF